MNFQANNSAFKIHMPAKCWGDFKIFQFALAMLRLKKKGYDLVFKQLRLLALPTYIVYL